MATRCVGVSLDSALSSCDTTLDYDGDAQDHNDTDRHQNEEQSKSNMLSVHSSLPYD